MPKKDRDKKRTLEELKNLLTKSGFPFEIETSNILERQGWNCIYNPKFTREEDIEGEIDILADKTSLATYFTKKKNMHDASVNLVIECKKSDQTAWVFYERKKLEIDPIDDLLVISNWGDDYTERILKKIKKNPFKNIPKATTYEEINLKKKGKPLKGSEKNLWTAELNLKYAIPFLFSDEGYSGIWFKSLPTLRIICPIIAYDGEIVLARIKRGKISLEKINHVQLVTDLQKTEYGNEPKRIIIDIVKKSHLKEFFKEKVNIYPEIIKSINLLRLSKKFKQKKDKAFEKEMDKFENEEGSYLGLEYKKK